ncbi:uncharacterized protein [Dysidea avara]|uniref:uncharacterized protein n=1 Tax=Dysidea avara TaxID=196820 RepID=UPI00331A52E2
MGTILCVVQRIIRSTFIVSKHILLYCFNVPRSILPGTAEPPDNAETQFVSAVCWKPRSSVLLAVNSLRCWRYHRRTSQWSRYLIFRSSTDFSQHNVYFSIL